MKRCAGVVVAMLLAAGVVRAEQKVETSTTPLTAGLDALVEQVTKTGDDGKPMVDSSYRASILSHLSRARTAVEEMNFRSAMQTCESMGQYASAASFRKQVKDFTAKLSEALKAEQVNLITKARALIAEVPAACAKTADAAALQPLADRIQEMTTTLSRHSSSSDSSLSLQSLQEQLSSARNGVREWANSLLAEETGDIPKALEALNRLGPNYSSGSSIWQNSKELQARIAKLRETVTKQAEQILASTREQLLAAKSSLDGAKISAEFTRQSERLSRSTLNDTVIQQQLDGLRNAMSYWTRVLQAEEKGEIQQALSYMGNMDSDSYGGRDSQLAALLTAKREALLKQLLDQPAKKPDDTITKFAAAEMAKADTLDQLLVLRTKLAGVQSVQSYGYRSSYGQQQGEVALLLADLQLLEAAKQALEARNFSGYLQTYPSYGPASNHRWKEITRRHHNELKTQIFAELFQLGKLKAAKGDTADQTLLKAADAALADKEWERALRALDAHRVCLFANQPPPAALADQLDSIRNFVAAQNHEKAGELELAATFYLRVLNGPAEHSPVAAATKEIARLRKSNPGLFEKLRAAPPAPLTSRTRKPGDALASAVPIVSYPYSLNSWMPDYSYPGLIR